MVKWRFGILLVMVLLVLPLRTETEDAEDEDESENDNDNYENEKEKDEETDDQNEKENTPAESRRMPPLLLSRSHGITAMTMRPSKQTSLECYVCSYKSDMPQRACLDPSKYRVRKLSCDNVNDKCFTTGLTKGDTYDAVVRGCRSSCLTTQETECCDTNQCNSRAFAVPVMAQKMGRQSETTSDSNKLMVPNVLYFVTILLIVQTVSRVTLF